MNSKDIELIQKMEDRYDTFMPIMNQLANSIEDFYTHYGDYIELQKFYRSEEWFRFIELEEIPVKCGVTSEDQLFDMICDHNELLGNLLELTSKMYKNY